MKRFASLEGIKIALATSLAYLCQANGKNDVQYHQRITQRPAFLQHSPRSSTPTTSTHSCNHKVVSSPKKPLNQANCESTRPSNTTSAAVPVSPLSNDTVNYIQLNPDHVERTSLRETHALFGTLTGHGYVERYDVYRRRLPASSDDETAIVHDREMETTDKMEMVAVDLSIGHRLNGHDKIVHGGILSLLIDEAMGWAAYESFHRHAISNGVDSMYKPSNTLLVTANLNIDYRAPFAAGSEAVLRVYLDRELTNGRKMYFTARLESYDGSVIYAEAESLFLCVASEKMEGIKNQ